MDKRAFTLIELLVVVAIISVLVAILLPALSLARQRAKITQCTSQLRQWGTVHLMYAQDNGDWFMAGDKIGSRYDAKSPEVVDNSPYLSYFGDHLKMAVSMFYCPFRPEFQDYWRRKPDWWHTMIGYTYLAGYDENVFPFFHNGNHSPRNLGQSEGWWVLMTDICRGWWNVNHMADDGLATNVLCVDSHVEYQTGIDESDPGCDNFDAIPATPYYGFRVLWKRTLK
jgi:prepilin-type N-terminal cleavage/methylation domain-containing protein